MARIELATLAVSHVVPGGTGPASALGYRLLTESGVDRLVLIPYRYEPEQVELIARDVLPHLR